MLNQNHAGLRHVEQLEALRDRLLWHCGARLARLGDTSDGRQPKYGLVELIYRNML